MSEYENEPAYVLFEAVITPMSHDAIRYIRSVCRISNFAETFRIAVALFDHFDRSFGEGRQVVLTTPGGSLDDDKDIWPVERWNETDQDQVTTFWCNINKETAEVVSRIKDEYELSSNDELVPLLFANYLKVVKGVLGKRVVRTYTFEGCSAQDLLLIHPPVEPNRP